MLGYIHIIYLLVYGVWHIILSNFDKFNLFFHSVTDILLRL